MSFLAMARQVFAGTGATMTIFFSTLIFSMPLGLLVAMGRMNSYSPFRRIAETSPAAWLRGFKPLQLIIKFLISILRGTPLMLQLIVWFYGPYYLFGIRLNAAWRVTATIVGFSINYAAYFAFPGDSGRRPGCWATTGSRPSARSSFPRCASRSCPR